MRMRRRGSLDLVIPVRNKELSRRIVRGAEMQEDEYRRQMGSQRKFHTGVKHEEVDQGVCFGPDGSE